LIAGEQANLHDLAALDADEVHAWLLELDAIRLPANSSVIATQSPLTM